MPSWNWATPDSATARAQSSDDTKARCGCRSTCMPKGPRCASTSSCIRRAELPAVTGWTSAPASATRAWAQITSPGAAKWYRAAAPAYQKLDLKVAHGATLEWLPQETIIFSDARAELSTSIDLQGDARLFYWDVVALGRPASGERFDLGHFQAQLDIRRDGQLLWHERQRIVGNDGLLDSPIGLDGQPVFATLLVTGEIDSQLLEKCRSLPNDVRGDLTQLPGLLVARCLASEALLARGWLIELWRLLRPALLGREAVPPRIWST